MDIRKEYLDFCKDHKVYDKLILGDLVKLPFKDKSVDLLICSEVIEHLNQRDGNKFLKEVDRVCRERAIITTPNLFYQTFEEGEADAHHSCWDINTFRQKGYKVYGSGIRMIIDRYDPLFRFKQALSIIATPFSYLFPLIGGSLICVKDYAIPKK